LLVHSKSVAPRVLDAAHSGNAPPFPLPSGSTATLPAVSSQAAGSRPASAATAPSVADGTAGGAGWFQRLWDHSRVKVGTLTAAAALVYCLDSLILFRRFLASTFD